VPFGGRERGHVGQQQPFGLIDQALYLRHDVGRDE
jgi:hypothetical protein